MYSSCISYIFNFRSPFLKILNCTAPADDLLEVLHKKVLGGDQDISGLDYQKWEM